MGKNIVLKDAIGENVLYENVDTIVFKDDKGGDFSIALENKWKPNPTWWDIKTILENDTRDYAYKVIYLYTNSTVSENSLALNGVAYATSDGAFYETSTLTHTWDLSKDKPCYINGSVAYKTRYVIVYSNSYIKPLTVQRNVLYLYGVNTTGVTDFYRFLHQYNGLEGISEIDTSSATSTNEMFYSCRSLSALPTLNISLSKSTKEMFYECYNLRQINNLDASSSITANSMFYKCVGLEKLSNLNLSSATSINSLLNECKSLSEVKNLDLSSATDVSSLFYNFYALKTVSGLKINSATKVKSLFYYNYALNSISDIEMNSAVEADYMFYYCYGLKHIPKLGTKNLQKLSYMFAECHSLESIGELDIISATSVSGMFQNCVMLTNLKLKNIKVSGISLSNSTALSQESLVNIIKELWDYSVSGGYHSLTMGNTNTNKLRNVYVRAIAPTAEQIAEDPNIESKMPCEVCESTDEGAMLILDYAVSKGWTIS